MMEKFLKKIRTNHFTSTFIINLIGFFFFFLFNSISSKILGPEDYGKFNLFMTLSVMISTIGSLSVGLSIIHEVGKTKIEPKRAVLSIWLISLCLSILISIIAFFTIRFFHFPFLEDMPLLWIFIGGLTWLVLNNNAVAHQAYFKIITFNWLKSLPYILLFLFLGILYIVGQIHLRFFMGIYLLSLAITTIISFISLFHWLSGEARLDRTFIKKCIKNGLLLHAGVVSCFFLSRLGQMMVAHYLGMFEVGVYSMAITLSEYLFLLSSLVVLVLYPKYSHATWEQVVIDTKKYTSFIFWSVVLTGGIFFLCSSWIVTIYANADYLYGISALKILIIGTIIYVIPRVLAPVWIKRGWFKQMAIISVGVTLLNIILNFILIPLYGINGAAWATMLSYSFEAIITLFLFYIYIDKKVWELFIIKKQDFVSIYHYWTRN